MEHDNAQSRSGRLGRPTTGIRSAMGNKIMKQGKIIAITGGPRSGKSTLVKLLSEFYNGVAYLEGEEKDFPKRIIDDIKNEKNRLELILYFRNLTVGQYIQALREKAKGRYCFMDCFWLTNQAYTDAWVENQFEKDILTKLSKLDEEILGWPDKVVVLENSKEGIRRFLQMGGREFEKTDGYLEKQMKIHHIHNSFFEDLKNKKDNIFILNRDNLDFIKNKDDIKKVIQLLEI
jgi:deoxyadenosine/deoxycytidine kinase